MSTDNLYMHTFSIRGSTCAPGSPYSFTDLSHRKETYSAALFGFWKVHREYIMFLDISATYVYFHSISLYVVPVA